MVYRYDCNGFFNQIRLESYHLALPVPGILKLCNYLQNVGAKTYIFGLQLSTFLFYNKQLDQRIINPMLPDEPGTKVNKCVSNILKIWKEGDAEKLTQLVFCDIATPSGKQTDDSEDIPFTNIYDDIRKKLIAGGMMPEQVAFIHNAKTDIQKKELFAKVRSGQVRVLIGSTSKMGAGTNCQDRLIALHDLDCPWCPRNLIQRKGRIERRGNLNPKVHVYRYVTNATFDAYLWVRHEVA